MAQGNDDFEELFEKLNSIEKREREELEQQLPPAGENPLPRPAGPGRRSRSSLPCATPSANGWVGGGMCLLRCSMPSLW